MRYVFNFSFAFEEESESAGGFLVDEAVIQRLAPGAPTPLTPDGVLNDVTYFEWFGREAQRLEAQFAAIHDVSGTQDDDTLVEGLTTYEIEDTSTAWRLLEAWREAFVARAGGETGIGPVVLVNDVQDIPDYRYEAKQNVALFEQAGSGQPKPEGVDQASTLDDTELLDACFEKARSEQGEYLGKSEIQDVALSDFERRKAASSGDPAVPAPRPKPKP